MRCWGLENAALPLGAERGRAEEGVYIRVWALIRRPPPRPPSSSFSILHILSQNWSADRKVWQNYFGIADNPLWLGHIHTHTHAHPTSPVPLPAGVIIVQTMSKKNKQTLKAMMFSDLTHKSPKKYCCWAVLLGNYLPFLEPRDDLITFEIFSPHRTSLFWGVYLRKSLKQAPKINLFSPTHPSLLPAYPLLQPPSPPPHTLCSYSHGCLAPFLNISPAENFSNPPTNKKKRKKKKNQLILRPNPANVNRIKPPPIPPTSPSAQPSLSLTNTPPLSAPAPPLAFALTTEATLHRPQRPLSGNKKEEGGRKRKPETSCQPTNQKDPCNISLLIWPVLLVKLGTKPGGL